MKTLVLFCFTCFLYAASAGIVEKKGTCPKPTGHGTCVKVIQCSRDIDCPGIQKCCRNSCGQTCQEPATSGPTYAASDPCSKKRCSRKKVCVLQRRKCRRSRTVCPLLTKCRLRSKAGSSNCISGYPVMVKRRKLYSCRKNPSACPGGTVCSGGVCCWNADFLNTFLTCHNTHRSAHGVPPLTMNAELNTAAQAWAEHLAKLGQYKHNKGYNGENLFYSCSSAGVPSGDVAAKVACEAWYKEIRDYVFANPGFNYSTGHFTQVVWKSSMELGGGYARSYDCYYVVGNYSPAGNINTPEYFADNVLPVK